MTDPSEDRSEAGRDQREMAAIASAIDAAADSDNQSHHGLPIDALARLDEEIVTAALRLALAQTFYRGLQPVDFEDPANICVSLTRDLGEEESDDVVVVWRALSGFLSHPMPKSLIHDLLFAKRDPNAGQHAREAIRLYQQTATLPKVSRHIRVYSALRAFTLSKQTNSMTELAQLGELLRNLVEEDIVDPTYQPGLTLPMAAALVDISRRTPGGGRGVADLLESVLNRYGTADHIDYIAELFRLAEDVTDERKSVVRRVRAMTRLDRARNEKTPELKLFRLEEAARVARDLGYPDLHEEAVAELQQVDTRSMNWIEVGSDLQYPPEIVAAYIGDFTFHGEWERGLRRWLATGPPSGRFSDNEALARRSLGDAVLQQLFSRFRVGAHGMPERRSSPDESLDALIRDVEYRHALVEGVLLNAALEEIGRLAKNASERELTSVIVESYRCPSVNATILAKALKLFWDSEYLVCAYLVTPFIEAGVRTLLLELNAPIYRVEQGKTKGQYAQLGRILPRLSDEGFDPDWIRYIQTLTLGDGQNYRNDIAHGFLRQMDAVVATLLLRASALFLIMPVESSTSDELRQLASRPAPRRPRRSITRRIRESALAAWRTFREP